MAVNVQNAFVGRPPIDGGVYHRAPLGTPRPTDALSALDSAYLDHGAVGEDGVAVNQTRDTTDVKMMGGETFVNVQTNYDEQVVITMMETDRPAVLATTFGDQNVEIVPATAQHGLQKTIYHTSEPLPISHHVIDTVYGIKTKRYYIDLGQVINLAEVKDLHSDATKYTLTIKTYKPLAVELKGGNVVEYRDDGALPAVPVLSTLSPASVGTAGGDLVTITGSGFLGTTLAKVGTDTVEHAVVNDSTLVIVAPAHAAGTANVVVTNATGASAPKALTFA